MLGSLILKLSWITESKWRYITQVKVKLDDSETAEKIYWSMTKRFLNNKKISITIPIFVNGELISHLQKKTNCFNYQFSKKKKKNLQLLELCLTFILFFFTKHSHIVSNLSWCIFLWEILIWFQKKRSI